MGKKKVLITGIGMVSPIGLTRDETWAAAKAGKSGIATITKFDSSRISAHIAGEVKGFAEYAAGKVEPKALRKMALFTQYAVVAAKEAWEDAAFGQQPDMDRTATLFGNGIGGMDINEIGFKTLFDKGPHFLSPLMIPELIPNEAAGNVSMMLGAKGPCQVVVTACASSTDALGFALDMIRAGRADVVIAGGTEATVQEYCMGGFCKMKALSTGFNDTPEKASRPFNADRDGFVLSEGAAVLILESEEHAKARGAKKIYAELAGYGATADAYHITAPDPSGAGAVKAFKLALADGCIAPEEVDYINAHGTSTHLNDAMETKAIKEVFGEHARKLAVSSTKSMTGHLLGAAGATEAAFTALAIKEGVIPPTINYENPDPELDLDYTPNTAAKREIRAAMSSSLGFGGHNAILSFRAYAG